MTAELTRESIDQVVTRIVEREQRTRRRVLLYTGIPVVLALRLFRVNPTNCSGYAPSRRE